MVQWKKSDKEPRNAAYASKGKPLFNDDDYGFEESGRPMDGW